MGSACAEAFAAAGCTKIALLDINPEGLEAAKALILSNHEDTGIQIVTAACDTSDEAQVQHAFSSVREAFGRLDYAINCAGVGQQPGSTAHCSTENFDRTIAINLRGVFLCSREELRIMIAQPLDSEVYPGISPERAQRGAIVHVASGLGLVAMAGMPAYCSSKAGVIALARSDATDHAADRVRVNAVLPGATATPLSQSIREAREAVEKYAVNVRTPMKRWGLAEEIADVCLFLCSNKASFIQGAALPVDGGYGAN